MKPVKKSELAQALKKLKKLAPLRQDYDLSQLALLMTRQDKEYLKRLVIRIGQQIKMLDIKDLSYFYIDERIVFTVNFKGDRYPVDLSLDQLEEQLDPGRFFRINRGFIVSLESIDSMFTYSKARIKIKLKPPCDLDTITSTERSAPFREWLKGH